MDKKQYYEERQKEIWKRISKSKDNFIKELIDMMNKFLQTQAEYNMDLQTMEKRQKDAQDKKVAEEKAKIDEKVKGAKK